LIELVDFSATVYALTGINPDYNHFGCDLLPLLKGETDMHRDAVFCEGGRLYGEEHAMEKDGIIKLSSKSLYWPKICLQSTDDGPYHGKAVMCRTKSFKYVRRLYEQDELYDLNKDPGEMDNIIDDNAYADIISDLKERILSWYLETCDVVPFKTDRRF